VKSEKRGKNTNSPTLNVVKKLFMGYDKVAKAWNSLMGWGVCVLEKGCEPSSKQTSQKCLL
jgi:hypothetical protein